MTGLELDGWQLVRLCLGGSALVTAVVFAFLALVERRLRRTDRERNLRHLARRNRRG